MMGRERKKEKSKDPCGPLERTQEELSLELGSSPSSYSEL